MSEETISRFGQGAIVRPADEDFDLGIREAVDFRGDCSVLLKSGSKIEGYIFNRTGDRLDLYPKDSSQIQSVQLADLEQIEFSGADTAKGKSYDEWQKKNALEKREITSQPIDVEALL